MAPLFGTRTRQVVRQMEASASLALADAWFTVNRPFRAAPHEPARLEKHIVICGFPRAGTSMLSLMIKSSIADTLTFDREVVALDGVAETTDAHRFLVTKRPGDIHRIDRIRMYYRYRKAKPFFLILLRDPRAVLTSRHFSKPDEYYVSIDRWRAIYQDIPRAPHVPKDVVIVRYEDLVMRCSEIEAELARAIGWTIRGRFEDFHQSTTPSDLVGALNGVRPLDVSSVNKWQAESHAGRLRSLLETQMPELPDRLIEMGYEKDDSWAIPYRKG